MDYVQILKKEYQDAGQVPWRISLNGTSLVIPYFYTLDAANKQKVAANFLNDFFDVNKSLAQDYKKRGEKPLYVESGGWKYVVPYHYAKSDYNADEIASKVFKKCLGKYKRSIALTRKINRLAPEEDLIVHIGAENYTKRRHKYEKLLAKRVVQATARGLLKAGEFFAAGITTVCDKGLGVDALKMKRALKKTLVGAAIVGGSYLSYQSFAPQEKVKEHVVVNAKDNKISFFEMCGAKYDDKYGNLQTLDRAYNDLCVVIAALEGFHGRAFDDGLGNWTIGYGSTFYINEDGKDAGKIKSGDTITQEEAFIQKQRYIAKYMVPCLMQVQRPLSEKEVVGLVATGFCIGPSELKESKFLELLSKGDEKAWAATSVYGKQAGVRKRTALTTAYVKGQVKIQELLDFGWKDGENVYGAKISDFYECPKGKQIPYKDAQGFCRGIHYDKVGNYVRDKIAQGVKHPVRGILPESIVCNVEKNMQPISFAAMVSREK